jgi:DNA-binding response OmpR family regulator
MDGFQVCRSLRQDPATSEVRILMLTAIYLTEEDKAKGFRVGADNFLVKPDVIMSKPVHLKELKDSVDALFDEKAASSQPYPPDRVLVVDDDEKNLRLMKMRLLSEGFEVQEASTGQAALDLVEPFAPHLVLLDIKMPQISGLDLLKELRSRGQDFPVVMMTAYGSEAIAVEAFTLGADDYLIKPFDTAMAARRLRLLIEGYRLKKSEERLTERLKKISVDLVNRVNYLELQNHRLEEAYARVRGLSEFNQRFIRSLSQELRAPLAMILNFSSLLRDTPPDKRDPSAEQDCTAAIFRTAFRLEMSLSNLIYLSRIQADTLQPVQSAADLAAHVNDTVALVRKALVREEVRIHWRPEPEGERVLCDAGVLKDILVNLLDSACQRIEGAGNITVELAPLAAPAPPAGPASRGFRITIADDGSPCTEGDLALSRISELSPETLKMGSEHLRLNLCRHLASLLGWDLDLSNRPGGGGLAVLTIRPPRRAD